MRRLYHPVLDRRIVRSDRQSRALAASGWRPDPPDEGDEQDPAEAGFSHEDVGGDAPAVTPDNQEG